MAPFRGRIPADLLYDMHHDMWVRRDGEEVIVGATAFGIHLAGEIIAFTAKPVGARIERGRGLGTIECAKTVMAVRSPLSLAMTAANEEAESNTRRINRDPYGEGWMVRGLALNPEAEFPVLVDAAAYRAHVLTLDPAASLEDA